MKPLKAAVDKVLAAHPLAWQRALWHSAEFLNDRTDFVALTNIDARIFLFLDPIVEKLGYEFQLVDTLDGESYPHARFNPDTRQPVLLQPAGVMLERLLAQAAAVGARLPGESLPGRSQYSIQALAKAIVTRWGNAFSFGLQAAALEERWTEGN